MCGREMRGRREPRDAGGARRRGWDFFSFRFFQVFSCRAAGLNVPWTGPIRQRAVFGPGPLARGPAWNDPYINQAQTGRAVPGMITVGRAVPGRPVWPGMIPRRRTEATLLPPQPPPHATLHI